MQQIRTKNRESSHADNFNKQRRFLFDNPSDETIMNGFEMYPMIKSYFFTAEGQQIDKQKLKQSIRKKFNATEEVYSASGKKERSKVAKAIARASLVPNRAGFLSLIRLNFRGLATRYSLLNAEGKKRLDTVYTNLGGKTDHLNAAIKAGKDKPIVVCGKKCRGKSDANAQVPAEKFVGMIEDDKKHFSVAALVIAAIISAAVTIIAIIDKGISGKKNYKRQEDLLKLQADLAQKDKEENAIDATMTPQEKALAEAAIAKQNANFDPVVAIQNNPNLTAQEKSAAISEIQKSSNIGIDSNKKIIIGVVLVLAAAYFIYTNKQKVQS